jgi:transcription-repair coupling factor (superfamily II helicase)
LPLYQGFIDEENQITCYGSPDFERYHHKFKKAIRKNSHSKELTTLSVGDYASITE